MSLRQLKFKPKLQLNTAIKNKTDESNVRSTKKEDVVSSNPTVIDSQLNKCEVIIIDGKSLENSKSETKESEDNLTTSNNTLHEACDGKDVIKSIPDIISKSEVANVSASNNSGQDSQELYAFSNDRQNKIDKKSLFSSISPQTESTVAVNKFSESERKECKQDEVVMSVILNSQDSIQIKSNRSALVPPFRCESRLVKGHDSDSTQISSDFKHVKKRKLESKEISVGSKKVNTYQRGNFKPNLITLGKIKRPEKFTTSSYSKMESVAKENFFKKFGKEEEPDYSKLSMMDFIFYNPSSNPMSQSSDKKVLPSSKNVKTEENNSNVPSVSDIDDKTSDGNKSDCDVLPVPQLKISADGKVIVAQESLVVEPSKNLSNTIFENVVDEEFKKRKPAKNPNRCGWSHNDTIKFYKALNSLGCDFETMQSIFPDRSRRNLKSKFKKEERLHGSLINKVLSRHSEFDLANVIREYEIDAVYNNTVKTYGRDLTEKKIRPGRTKQISTIIAGKSLSDDEKRRKEIEEKKKKELEVVSKISKALGLNHSDDSTDAESKNASESDTNTKVLDVKEGRRTKRKMTGSKKVIECKNSRKTARMKNQEIEKHSNKILPNNSIVIRLEDLINFNEGVDNETSSEQSKSEVINENHIVINTNIEFENVKYTRYISYNSNNLENPIEINETVAHVD